MSRPAVVRLALPRDALSITGVQRSAWDSDPYARGLLAMIDEAAMAAVWEQAIRRPPMAHLRVLVALAASDGDTPERIVGAAAIQPSADPDAGPRDSEVAEFVIAPDARGQGHGSRLLNAVADTMRADGYLRAVWWIRSGDDALRAFATSTGWAPDGAHREIGTEDGAARIRQVRLHTDLSPADEGPRPESADAGH